LCRSPVWSSMSRNGKRRCRKQWPSIRRIANGTHRLRPSLRFGYFLKFLCLEPEVLQRSNKSENACETSCRVRSVPRSFSELRDVAVMAWKRSSVRSRSGPPINPLQINSMSRKHSSGRERWVRCMAANLLKAGHEVTVCDLAPDAVRQFNTSETHGHSISAR